MSQRKRYSGGAVRRSAGEDFDAILRAMIEKEGYPAADEREAIVQRRGEIMFEMIREMVSSGGQSQEARAKQAVQRYGLRDTVAVLKSLQRSFERPGLIAEKAWIFRQYRQAYARFGGERRFVSYAEYEELTTERGKMEGRRRLALIKLKPSRRERELDDLLLTPPAVWEDVLPPDTPRRPADFKAPAAGEYSGPASELLGLGWDLKTKKIDGQAQRWRTAIPDLARMALDEGLLRGWPGETASWAPYYALHLLGALQAHEYAARLMDLHRQPDDWLSDLLPGVWGRMGLPVEAVLWRMLDDEESLGPERRGLAGLGLQSLARTYPKRRLAVIQGLAERLGAEPSYNAILNAYIIHILDDMGAGEARQAVAAAFEQGKVALDIMRPEDVGLLEG